MLRLCKNLRFAPKNKLTKNSLEWNQLLKENWSPNSQHHITVNLSGIVTSNFSSIKSNLSTETTKFYLSSAPYTSSNDLQQSEKDREDLAKAGISCQSTYKIVVKKNLRRELEQIYSINNHIGNLIQPGMPMNVIGSLKCIPNDDVPFCYDFEVEAYKIDLPENDGEWIERRFEPVVEDLGQGDLNLNDDKTLDEEEEGNVKESSLKSKIKAQPVKNKITIKRRVTE